MKISSLLINRATWWYILARGNPDGTVLNALLHYYPPIADVPRAGIVHRLDKDTTGLMVVAKPFRSDAFSRIFATA